MSCKNIAKNFAFVTIFLPFCFAAAGCGWLSANNFHSSNRRAAQPDAETSPDYQKPKVIGTISSAEISESSGLVASGCNRDVFWTHNDSGDKNYIFALDARGKKLATYRVAGAENDDWEDMATFKTPGGECYLYLGDIGNNARERGEFTIYRVREPQLSGATDSSRKNPLSTEAADSIKFDYPDMRHDAETLLAHPQTGDLYILSKRISGAAGVYKLLANFSTAKKNTLTKIADFSVPAVPNGLLTGGAISPDGKRVVICDYFSGYEIVLPAGAKNFDDIWKEKPLKVDLGERKQGETVTYAPDGKSIYATSEKKNSPLIQINRK